MPLIVTLFPPSQRFITSNSPNVRSIISPAYSRSSIISASPDLLEKSIIPSIHFYFQDHTLQRQARSKREPKNMFTMIARRKLPDDLLQHKKYGWRRHVPVVF